MARTAKRSTARGKWIGRFFDVPLELRLWTANPNSEEGYSRQLPVDQASINTHSIQRQANAFRLHGAAKHAVGSRVSRKGLMTHAGIF